MVDMEQQQLDEAQDAITKQRPRSHAQSRQRISRTHADNVFLVSSNQGDYCEDSEGSKDVVEYDDDEHDVDDDFDSDCVDAAQGANEAVKTVEMIVRDANVSPGSRHSFYENA
jgi:hypothetical protein